MRKEAFQTKPTCSVHTESAPGLTFTEKNCLLMKVDLGVFMFGCVRFQLLPAGWRLALELDRDAAELEAFFQHQNTLPGNDLARMVDLAFPVKQNFQNHGLHHIRAANFSPVWNAPWKVTGFGAREPPSCTTNEVCELEKNHTTPEQPHPKPGYDSLPMFLCLWNVNKSWWAGGASIYRPASEATGDIQTQWGGVGKGPGRSVGVGCIS